METTTTASAASTTKITRSKPVRGNLVKSMTFTAKDASVYPTSRYSHRNESGLSRNEEKRREAVWDLFQSETAFLLDHLMVMKHVRKTTEVESESRF